MVNSILRPKRSKQQRREDREQQDPEHGVCFGNITVTCFPMVLGDNPACSDGAPVQLGKQPIAESITQRIDLYEYFRQSEDNSCQIRRRSKKRSNSTSQLLLSVETRTSVLLQAGYTAEDITKAAYKVKIIRQMRTDSMSAFHGDRWTQIFYATGKAPINLVQGILSTAGKALRSASGSSHAASSLKRSQGSAEPKCKSVQARTA